MGETLTMKRILVADHSEIANRMFCAGLSKYGFQRCVYNRRTDP